MSEQDRGAYAPPNDAPLAFDPRHDGDRRGPAPLALIVSTLFLIALIAGLVAFYRHGVRKPGQPPQVVGAPLGDTKTLAAPSEAPSDATAGLQVYKSESPLPNESAPTFAPAPEQPQPRPIARPPAPPQPVSVTPLRPAEPAASAAPAVKQVVVAKPPPAPAAVKAPVAVKAAQVQAASAARPAKPPKPAPVAAAQSVAAAASGGGAQAQIGAFSSSALAEKGWSDAVRAAPAQMAGKHRSIEVTTRDGKTFYRAIASGFSSRADVVSFCSALRAAHTVCIVK